MNNLFASKTRRDPGLHFSILRTRLCVFRLRMHAHADTRRHTLVCLFCGADTEKRVVGGFGDEFRNMHIEAQLAEAGMKKGNDWRAGCYKLDYSSQTHQDSLSLHTHTSAGRISSLCAVSTRLLRLGVF